MSDEHVDLVDTQNSNLVNTQKPTLEQANAFQSLFDYFNDALFDGRLKQPVIGHRGGLAYGSFTPAKFVRMGIGGGEQVASIALNPTLFRARPQDPPLSPQEQVTADFRELCQTLCHEMAHQYDHLYGKPGVAGYHSRTWVNKMKQIGLPPSSTGQPGGAELGYHMLEYVEPDGPFDKAFQRLLQNPPPVWRDRLQLSLRPAQESEAAPTQEQTEPKKKKVIKFVCPFACGFNYRATPRAGGIGRCGNCGNAVMVPANLEEAAP
jgi:hypothetical protein